MPAKKKPTRRQAGVERVDGQDPKTGKFLPGNNAGRTKRPIKSKQYQFRQVLLKCLTEKDFRKVVETLKETAAIVGREGDKAREQLFAYAIGKPKETLEIDTVGLAKRQVAEMLRERWIQLLQRLPPEIRERYIPDVEPDPEEDYENFRKKRVDAKIIDVTPDDEQQRSAG